MSYMPSFCPLFIDTLSVMSVPEDAIDAHAVAVVPDFT